MLRLVLDTNTIVSGLLWHGNEFELLEKIEGGQAHMLINPEMLTELHRVLHYQKINNLIIKSGLADEKLFQKIISLSHLAIGPKLNIAACRDKEDNKVLECAINGKADFIVSGDDDLLILKEFKGIKIIKTSEILNMLK